MNPSVKRPTCLNGHLSIRDSDTQVTVKACGPLGLKLIRKKCVHIAVND